MRAIVLDIEGTTTPIAFVHEVLFPYARARLSGFLAAEWMSPEVAEAVRRLTAERTADKAAGEHLPPWSIVSTAACIASVAAYCGWLMDRDRKSPGLKLVQGLIWERGYQAGELRGVVYPDVAPALGRWRDAGLDIAIYSSGSELAQRRLFQSTADGDLSPLVTAFFDTAVGAKTERESYRHIAAALGHLPGEVLFVSDLTCELAAAREAGFDVRLSLRPGNAPQADADAYLPISSFAEISESE